MGLIFDGFSLWVGCYFIVVVFDRVSVLISLFPVWVYGLGMQFWVFS